MNNLFKGWKNMTPEEKKTEKIAISIMGIIMIVIAGLFIIALSGCGGHKDSQIQVALELDPIKNNDTLPKENIDTLDNIVDEICYDWHGKEGKSEYGEYKPNE